MILPRFGAGGILVLYLRTTSALEKGVDMADISLKLDTRTITGKKVAALR